VLEYYGTVFGADGPHQDLVMDKVRADSDFVLTDKEYIKRAVATGRKKILGIGFLKRADRKCYGGLWIELENQFTRGQDHYPNNLTGAYIYKCNYVIGTLLSHSSTRICHFLTGLCENLTYLCQM
jgi:hypothetical protein